MDVVEARTILGLTAGAPAPEIDRAFRAVAATCHPDRGGDPAAFHRAVEARRVLHAAGLASVFTARPEVRIVPPRSLVQRVRHGIDLRYRRRYAPRVDPRPERRRSPLR